MFTMDHLALRLFRIKSPEQWIQKDEELSFLFPSGGAGEYTNVHATCRLAPGDVLVANGASAGKVCPANGGEIVFWLFSLSLEHLFPLFACEEIPHLQDVTEALRRSKRIPASGALAKECHQLIRDVPPHFNLAHRSQLLRVAATILTAEFENAHPHRVGFVRVEDHLIQTFEKLSVTELLNLSVDELANKFNCSRRHLNRLFHRYFGFSVAGMRMEMRLLKAISLLRDPDMKIIHVAEKCGFNHQGLFNTCFKRRFRASPSQWRKSTAAVEDPSANRLGSSLICPLRSHNLCPLVPKGSAPERTDRAGTHPVRALLTSASPPEMPIGPTDEIVFKKVEKPPPDGSQPSCSRL